MSTYKIIKRTLFGLQALDRCTITPSYILHHDLLTFKAEIYNHTEYIRRYIRCTFSKKVCTLSGVELNVMMMAAASSAVWIVGGNARVCENWGEGGHLLDVFKTCVVYFVEFLGQK